MTTTAQDTAAEPVLGEIIVTGQGVAWTLGGHGVVRGLTIDGIAAAAKASAGFLGALSDAEKQAIDQRSGRHQVRISAREWLLPAPHGRATEIATLMTGVVNAPGAIGQVG